MKRGLAIFLAGCVRHGVDVPVIDVRAAKPLPAIEALAVDPIPAPPEDFFVELSLVSDRDLYGAAILPDRNVRLRFPGNQGCAGQIGMDEAGRILGIVDRIGFFSLKAEYPSVVRGSVSGWRITVHARGQQKTLVHFDGEHSAIVRGVLKGVPDVGERLGLIELEDAIQASTRWERITYLRPIDLERRAIPAWRAQARVDDGLQLVRLRCGSINATALQLRVDANGAVTAADPIPGGVLDACAEEVLHDLAFDPSCSGMTGLFTLDSEGLHAEVHQLAPAE